MNGEQLARGLGWASIGLGLTEVAAPRWLARQIGVRDTHSCLLQILGLREILSGIGILAQPRNPGFVWSRVAGDAVDLTLLGAALTPADARTGRIMAASAAVVGVMALDVIVSQELSAAFPTASSRTIHMKHAVAIERTPEELYTFWRDFQNLPRFMKHVQSVRAMDPMSVGNRSHWVVKAPGGSVEWDAEIIVDRPNELISWRSLDEADVPNQGVVRFEGAPGGRGTTVEVEIEYVPPAGQLGAAVARLFGEEPRWQVKDDLRRFKQLMEAGEVITTEGQPAGRASSTSRKYDTAVGQ